ncbi:hypothetical protein HYH03_007751 [Edaphochlamys debaryana]|uniref:Uncharacterized protein n=1 Tax=Edaphochlamys debaryana TaxID=47281 RepID=A0A836BZM5_9CHLO|nr:hypothetical protein HYH03_007751 [Edaphochlamys debaryana]|eukprot:KAG2494112.1 hypothetical protein HYH03_007751 [Edaphochlamys debaryana]
MKLTRTQLRSSVRPAGGRASRRSVVVVRADGVQDLLAHDRKSNAVAAAVATALVLSFSTLPVAPVAAAEALAATAPPEPTTALRAAEDPRVQALSEKVEALSEELKTMTWVGFIGGCAFFVLAYIKATSK